MEVLATKKAIEDFILEFVSPHFIFVEEKKHVAHIYLYFQPEEFGKIKAEPLKRLLNSELEAWLPITASHELYVRKFEPLTPHEIYSIKELIKMDFWSKINQGLDSIRQTQEKANKRMIKNRRRQFIFILIILIIETILLFFVYGSNNNNQRHRIRGDQENQIYAEGTRIQTQGNEARSIYF